MGVSDARVAALWEERYGPSGYARDAEVRAAAAQSVTAAMMRQEALRSQVEDQRAARVRLERLREALR